MVKCGCGSHEWAISLHILILQTNVISLFCLSWINSSYTVRNNGSVNQLQVVTGLVSVFKATISKATNCKLNVKCSLCWTSKICQIRAQFNPFLTLLLLCFWFCLLKTDTMLEVSLLRHSCMSRITKLDKSAQLTLVKLWLDNSSSGQRFTEHSVAY